MNFISKISGRWVALLVILGLWTVVLVQACDRGAERADDNGPVAEAGNSDNGEKAKEPGEVTTLPGETEPGTVQPTSPGPKAPAVFFLSGLKGYLEPCGCSAEVLLGGIDRITGYVDAAQKLYPDTAMLDAGDMLFEFAELEDHAIPQEKAKTDVIVAAQKALGTEVTVPGELDFALGTDFYKKTIEQAGVEPLAANLKIDGKAVAATKVLDLENIKLGVVGAVDPELYKGVEDVSTSEAAPSVKTAVAKLKEQGAQTIVLLMHGDLEATQNVLKAVEGIDFGVIGHGPRETDQIYEVNGAHTLEAYDQGRYLGVLKLYRRDKGEPYANAGAGSKTQIEKVQRLIEHKKKQLERFPPSKQRENPPILQRIKDDIAKREAELEELRTDDVNVPEGGNAFIYRPVPMEPGLPLNDTLTKRRNQFNENLQELQSKVEREIPAVEEGQAFFVGNQECARCHVQEQAFWEKTEHATAVETLEERNKLFDQSCIGCHVVGYEKPGGSVIGKLHYEAKLGDRTIEKNLEDVGCENCHGPGSEHVQAPIDASGNPQHIKRDPVESDCMECHVPEHSPKFNFDAYVKDITGEGHEMSTK